MCDTSGFLTFEPLGFALFVILVVAFQVVVGHVYGQSSLKLL